MTEADLCASFIRIATKDGDWLAYPETGGFDIVLVRKVDGVQIGVEAKLLLNVKVLTQILPHRTSSWQVEGPDYRAVLVPAGKTVAGLRDIAHWLGVTVICPDTYRRNSLGERVGEPNDLCPRLPGGRFSVECEKFWHEWCPIRRINLPDYVPDVDAGCAAPVALTLWKVKAIKLQILLRQRPVTRADFKHLGLSPSRWTDRYTGWLEATPDGYVARPGMPDLEAQHPRNWTEIAADLAQWAPPHATLSFAKGDA